MIMNMSSCTPKDANEPAKAANKVLAVWPSLSVAAPEPQFKIPKSPLVLQSWASTVLGSAMLTEGYVGRSRSRQGYGLRCRRSWCYRSRFIDVVVSCLLLKRRNVVGGRRSW